MELEFYKYHGTGNDFILIDDPRGSIQKKLTRRRVSDLCQRRFGIGADGLMLIQKQKGFDFKMVYYNSDGRRSSMCGNGGRCIAHLAHQLGHAKNKMNFIAVDGPHLAEVQGDRVVLEMSAVERITRKGSAVILDTGSPHYVQFVAQVEPINVAVRGAKIRYSPSFKKEGINVNFVELLSARSIAMATYERGVEDETYSCGTGVVAAAIASHHSGKIKSKKINVKTKGGNLKASFELVDNRYVNIRLEGPVVQVAQGRVMV